MGYAEEEIERRRQEISVIEELTERKRQQQKQQQYNKIQRNHIYNRIVVHNDIPNYLKSKNKNICRIARFRCGNEVKVNCKWLKEEEKLCRLCKMDVETMEHLVEACEETRNMETTGRWQMILGENGNGEQWMRMIEEKRTQVQNAL